ncbi:MAG TPA: MFS transporter [Candidatus Dormibacteraeota bacterium]|nr:MFS transporter [Candidatus Dormibacteraeota bacterium]
MTTTAGVTGAEPSPLAVLRSRSFLLLWLSQALSQVGGNMAVYGLTVIVYDATGSASAISLLILTYLVPAVLFSAVAGVFVDRIDRRSILVVTNVLRGVAMLALFAFGHNLVALYLLNIVVSTITVFFAPAEAAMIPSLVPRSLLLAANSLFVFTLNTAFAIGFALLGPLVARIAGAPALLVVIGLCYLGAAAFCTLLPSSPVERADVRGGLAEAERAVSTTIAQLREGLQYIRSDLTIAWSLIYLGIAASLIGVLGVIGPKFATTTLGLSTTDFVVVVLPLGLGVVLGVLTLNSYGRWLPRRRVIETGMIALGALIALLTAAGPISRFLEGVQAQNPTSVDLSTFVSLLAVVVAIAFLAGIAYAFVAIPAQTQLQEELPEDVRGRVFGVLNMLVSVASFVPIIIVGPLVDLVGTTVLIIAVGLVILVLGVASIVLRGPLAESEAAMRADMAQHPPGPVDAAAVAYRTESQVTRPDVARARAGAAAAREARIEIADARDDGRVLVEEDGADPGDEPTSGGRE